MILGNIWSKKTFSHEFEAELGADLLIFFPKDILCVVFLFETSVEIEVEQFKQTPLDCGPDMIKYHVVVVLDVFDQNVPGSPYYLLPLGGAGVVLELSHYLLQKADVEHSELVGLF